MLKLEKLTFMKVHKHRLSTLFMIKVLTAAGPLVRTVPAVSVPVESADQRHAVARVALKLVDRTSLARRRRAGVQSVRTLPRVSRTAAGRRRSRADAVGLVCPVRVPVPDPRLVDEVLAALARELGPAAAAELVLHVRRAVHSPIAPRSSTDTKEHTM
jgi:hypothetical protein